jgi:hypothetical protein
VGSHGEECEMSSMLDPIKKIVNAAATAAIEKDVSGKMAKVVNALVGSVSEAVKVALDEVQKLTKVEETTSEGEGEP